MRGNSPRFRVCQETDQDIDLDPLNIRAGAAAALAGEIHVVSWLSPGALSRLQLLGIFRPQEPHV